MNIVFYYIFGLCYTWYLFDIIFNLKYQGVTQLDKPKSLVSI